MGTKITIELDEDMINDLVLQDLISHFENSDNLTNKQYRALAIVIKYYSTKKEWNQFVDRNQSASNINLRELTV